MTAIMVMVVGIMILRAQALANDNIENNQLVEDVDNFDLLQHADNNVVSNCVLDCENYPYDYVENLRTYYDLGITTEKDLIDRGEILEPDLHAGSTTEEVRDILKNISSAGLDHTAYPLVDTGRFSGAAIYWNHYDHNSNMTGMTTFGKESLNVWIASGNDNNDGRFSGAAIFEDTHVIDLTSIARNDGNSSSDQQGVTLRKYPMVMQLKVTTCDNTDELIDRVAENNNMVSTIDSEAISNRNFMVMQLKVTTYDNADEDDLNFGEA